MKNMEILKNELNKMVEAGKIKDWGFGNYEFWQNVVYVEKNNGKKVFLAKSEINRRLRSRQLKVVNDYKNITMMKNKVIQIINEEGWF